VGFDEMVPKGGAVRIDEEPIRKSKQLKTGYNLQGGIPRLLSKKSGTAEISREVKQADYEGRKCDDTH